MDCDDAEEARDLLRHKNSNVTRAIYRAHSVIVGREQLRARMERRMERSADTEAQDDRARTRSNAGSRALGSSWRRLLGLHSERLPVLAQLCPLKEPLPQGNE